MCGIAGIVSAADHQRRRIDAMTAALAHRGPDDAGIERLPDAALGHRRLSIIDLDGGHQPLANAQRDMHIVFNGEIYNFPALRRELARNGVTFRTRTDTEVILALYEREGERCVQRLRGMFAFAIWDERHHRLVLARDRMGQKPLFYRRLPDGGLAFASEVKGLLAGRFAEPTLDLQALYHYISLRYIPDSLTLFTGIAKLPAAHLLVLEHGDIRVSRYWNVSYLEKETGDEQSIRHELDRRLRESVRMHALADVPVGAFVSGGIDSSLVTGMLADQSPQPIDTFALGVREHDFNELPFARRVAERWGTAHREAVVAADLVHLVPRMIWHMDEPSDPFGVGVYLVSQLAAQHVKVVLTGDGGDELFAGYDRFAGNRLVDFYAVLPATLRRTVLRALANRVPDSFGYKSLAQKVRWVNEMSLLQGGDRYALSMSFLRFTEDAKHALFRPEALAGLSEPESTTKILEHYNASCVEDAVDRMLYTDGMTRLPDHLLMIVDRMAMAHGLEARPPLLDHEIVEYAARIPSSMKLRGRHLKVILRRTAAAYLPPDIVAREKQGFGFPIGRWMRTALRPLLEETVATSRFVESGLFDRDYMRRLLAEHLSGRSDHHFRLWILLNLELWHRLYLEHQSAEQVSEWMRPYARRPVRVVA
ncbi:MAG TPA: asparagine synthase (glutamine-hydrolyzing) [Gemmatimonadaceae bacterium]|nr:asparagine synthase (glutamine-hydrolyzing) [Gemmatimonadaceae bacterium]